MVINEVMSSNGITIEDEDGDNEDWVEFYNPTDETIDLLDYGLSDDYDNLFKWILPDVSIEPGEFLLIWTSGKDHNDPDAPLHTNFSINNSGEEVIITNSQGELIDEIPPTNISTDISYGRFPDGDDNLLYFENPTPGEPNTSAGFEEILDPVIFSHSGGSYTSSVDLTLSHEDPDVTIIYTLDGSIPDPDNLEGTTYTYRNQYPQEPSQTYGPFLENEYTSHVYREPLTLVDRSSDPNHLSHISTTGHYDPPYFPTEPVFKGTVVRAKVVKPNATSRIETNTFLISPMAEYRYSLPIISFGIQEDALFDYEEGIYVSGTDHEINEVGIRRTPGNYNWRGIEAERKAHMEVFETNGNHAVLKQNMGLRIHGNASRTEPVKSLRLYARNTYGESRFNYQFFPDMPDNRFNRLMLRVSGQDLKTTMFRDAAIQKIVEHMNFDTQAYRPFIVLINGEYWGIHNLRERYDRHYLERTYGVDPDNIDLLTDNALEKEGDASHYNETIDYIEEHGLAADEHYEYIRTRIDEENFLDYHIAQIYADNSDWPGSNIDFWRYRTNEYQPDSDYGHDGRWRWLMFDMDFGFGLLSASSSRNRIEQALRDDGPGWPNPPWSTFLFRNLMDNEAFRTKFFNRFSDQLNTAFKTERVTRIIQDLKDQVEPEIDEMIDRWGQPGEYGQWASWESSIPILFTFAEERPEYQRQHLRGQGWEREPPEYFNINETELTLDTSNPKHGNVQVNTILLGSNLDNEESNAYPWKGTYYEEYPVTLKAISEFGYSFSHWEVGDQRFVDNEIEVDLSQHSTAKAVFNEEELGEVELEPYAVSSEDYQFNGWNSSTQSGSFPDHMAFVYMDEDDPGLKAQIDGFTEGAYDLDSRTRINGLGSNGLSFINTGNEEGNAGYPGRRLGGLLFALDTSGEDIVYVSWTGGTVTLNSREYRMRLQYRTSDSGEFNDVLDANGKPVEYVRHSSEHIKTVGPVALPEHALDRRYIQLFWRYYHTGKRFSDDSGARDELSLNDIRIMTELQASELGIEQLKSEFPINGVPPVQVSAYTDDGLKAINYIETVSLTLDEGTGTLNGTTTAELANGQAIFNNLSFSEVGDYTLRAEAGNLVPGISSFKVSSETDLEEETQKEIPEEFTLSQNYPNPFNSETLIQYGVPEDAANVRIEVYDILGRKVNTLYDGPQSAGNHFIPFDAGQLASGLYIYVMQSDNIKHTKKMLLVK